MNERQRNEYTIDRLDRGYINCQNCNINIAVHDHHLFPQTKLNKKLYKEFIHDPRNILYVCHECHEWGNKLECLPRMDEISFCTLFGIEPRTKSGIEKWKKFLRS
jgi:hypothetical protein